MSGEILKGAERHRDPKKRKRFLGKRSKPGAGERCRERHREQAEGFATKEVDFYEMSNLRQKRGR